MHFNNRHVLAAAMASCIGLFGSTALWASDADFATDDAMVFEQTNLDSNIAGNARFQNSNLTNAWGLAFAPGGAFWINGNHSGTSNLIKGDGTVVNTLVVTIPSPSGAVSAPTGIVANPTAQFFLPGSKLAAAFIFDTEDGTVAAWNPGVDATHAVIAVDNSHSGAVYKGLAFGSNVKGNFIYAANFSAGTIDVFDSNFAPAATDGKFIDQHIRPGFAPFGIQNIDGDIWVTYAKQDAEKMDDDAAPGNGFVDVFDTDGHLLRRFAQHGVLNSPWGLARAPFGFGQFSGDILIGNQGDGRINAFDVHGNFVGALHRQDGRPIKIDRLWALQFGGGALSSPEQLFFTAGPDDENNGLFGVINAVPRDRYRSAD
ncbi:MAG TPA: TIGR03118 family protein [Steroidobacteraceae bacterium]|jgi:uncharacterized protein (TIGR03118 family)|nr:TIGR03118 family protein [Steroidobacteraceae bacterium]